MDDLTKISDENMKRVEGLTNKIDELTASVRTMSETQLWMEKQLLALRKNLIRTETAIQIDFKHNFPIDDEEVFKTFVKDLNDESYNDVMVSSLRHD